MKVERFIREYASYIKKVNEHNELMNPGIRAEIARRIDDTLKAREYGWITVDEVMRSLGNGCMRDGEDMSAYMTKED